MVLTSTMPAMVSACLRVEGIDSNGWRLVWSSVHSNNEYFPVKIARLLLVVAFMSMSLSGHASTVTARQDSPAPKTSTVNVEIIVDASGSMAAETNTGELRIDSAKRVLTEVINAIPEAEGVNVGLRVYGHLGDNTDEGRMESCVSSDLLAPIEGVDKPSLLAQVDTLQPVGWTPIGYALEQASADFTQPGSDDVVNAIVMVTDGLETCDADPAAIAGRLHASDAGITTHVIGFGTTPEEQAILSGIAEAGEGELLGSDNTGQLQATLFEVLEELDVVEETGTGESRESPLGIGRAGRVGDYDVSVILADAAIEESGTSGGRDFTVFVSLTFQGARFGTPSSDLQFVGVGDLGILYTEASNGCKDSLGGLAPSRCLERAPLSFRCVGQSL